MLLELVTANSKRVAYAGGQFANNDILVDKYPPKSLVRSRFAQLRDVTVW